MSVIMPQAFPPAETSAHEHSVNGTARQPFTQLRTNRLSMIYPPAGELDKMPVMIHV